jgi:hypothetical protein
MTAEDDEEERKEKKAKDGKRYLLDESATMVRICQWPRMIMNDDEDYEIETREWERGWLKLI